MSKCILIAESGSTKTDWVLLEEGKKRSFETQGINPYLMTTTQIAEMLSEEFPGLIKKKKIDQIHFYGAGINDKKSGQQVAKGLKGVLSVLKIETYNDLMASVHACAGREKSIVCILGTGSNSCVADTKKVYARTTSLGYVLGDEGSGNHLGRELLRHYYYRLMDKELHTAFEESFDLTLGHVLSKVYKEPFANRYMAGFASFIADHRGHYMIENILEDCLNLFFLNHILIYKNVHKMPIHFTGGIAYAFRDKIKALCEQYNLQLGHIIKQPMKGLIALHTV